MNDIYGIASVSVSQLSRAVDRPSIPSTRRCRVSPESAAVFAGLIQHLIFPVRAADRCRARAAPALAVRGRLPRSGKSSPLIPSLRSLPRRVRMRLSDRCQAELLPVAFCVYADHRDRTRREESPRRFSCFAARGPLQTAAAVQHRHGAGGQR